VGRIAAEMPETNKGIYLEELRRVTQGISGRTGDQ
jgi:hypothetical protein